MGITRCPRGVGDFYLVAGARNVDVKPFLSSSPNVRMFHSRFPARVAAAIVATKEECRSTKARSFDTEFLQAVLSSSTPSKRPGIHKKEESVDGRCVFEDEDWGRDEGGRAAHVPSSSDLQFAILATDGLWDVLAPERAVAIVRDCLRENVHDHHALVIAAETLVRCVRRSEDVSGEWAAPPKGSRDDVSVFVIRMPLPPVVFRASCARKDRCDDMLSALTFPWKKRVMSPVGVRPSRPPQNAVPPSPFRLDSPAMSGGGNDIAGTYRRSRLESRGVLPGVMCE